MVSTSWLCLWLCLLATSSISLSKKVKSQTKKKSSDEGVSRKSPNPRSSTVKRKRKGKVTSIDMSEVGVFSTGILDSDIENMASSLEVETDTITSIDDYLPDIDIRLEATEDYMDVGVQYAMKSDFIKALQHFWAASHFSSFDAGVWYNLALTISNYAGSVLNHKNTRRENIQNKEMHAIVCEGINARAIASLLRYEDRDGIIGPQLGGLIALFGGEDTCEASAKSLSDKKRTAKALEMALDDSQKAAAMYCRSPDDVMLTLTENMKKRTVLPASFVLAYLSKMYVCGVVGIRNMFEPSFIDSLQAAHLEEYDPSMLKGHVETSTIAYRGGLRYEVRWPLRKPFTDPSLTQNPSLLSLVKGAVGGNQIELDTFSHVDALPKAVMQAWHEDVEPVHKNTQQGETRHSPPQGVVVIVPMVNVNEINGPTEFISGSHVNLPWHRKDKNQQGKETSTLKIPSNKGDCIIFDLRIRHRGTPNKSPDVRPIIYMSYVHAWYRDAVNFKGKQTREWDQEFQTTSSKKLFMRVDQQRYIEKLEQALIEKGVDVKKLQSKSSYSAGMMRV